MKINRREFLSLAGKSAAGAVIFTACGLPENELIVQAPVEMPEDLLRGEDAWYATTIGDLPGNDGVIVRVMEGRAKKLLEILIILFHSVNLMLDSIQCYKFFIIQIVYLSLK